MKLGENYIKTINNPTNHCCSCNHPLQQIQYPDDDTTKITPLNGTGDSDEPSISSDENWITTNQVLLILWLEIPTTPTWIFHL